MNLSIKLPNVGMPKRKSAPPKGRTALVQWDRQTLKFLVVSRERQDLRVVAFEKVEREPEKQPLEQLSELLKQDRISVSQYVVLLSRAELEMVNVMLPPSEMEEVPDLVRAQVEEQIGDSDQLPAVDYLLDQFQSSQGGEALAFAIDPKTLDALQQQVKKAGARLAGVIPRSLASWGLLQQTSSRPLAIAITRFDSEIELMVLHRGQPSAVRTIRTRTDDMQVLAEQVATEIQRCLTVAENSNGDESPHLFVFGDREVFAPLVDTLVEQFDGPVSLLNPFDSLRLEGTVDRLTCHQYAALAGAAQSFFSQSLPVNLIEPKQSPKPPSPIRRWAFMGGAVAAALIGLVYFLGGELQTLRQDVAEKKSEFESKANMARKRQERADDLRVAESWLRDEVNWLDQLKEISEALPNGQEVTVRRLSASVRPEGNVVNLSVQVSEPDKVADLENRLRTIASSVTSKRVSEQTSDEDYPWQFETLVVLPRQPAKLVAPDELEEEADDEAAAGSGQESVEGTEKELREKGPGADPSQVGANEYQAAGDAS